MTQIRLLKREGSLIPSLPEDEDKLRKIKYNQIIEVQIKKPRNGRFHRKFFALLGIVSSNTGFSTPQLLHMLKLKLGHYESVVDPRGNSFFIEKSISFSAMGDIDFARFYNSSVNVILTDFMVGTTMQEIETQVNNIMGFL